MPAGLMRAAGVEAMHAPAGAASVAIVASGAHPLSATVMSARGQILPVITYAVLSSRCSMI